MDIQWEESVGEIQKIFKRGFLSLVLAEVTSGDFLFWSALQDSCLACGSWDF
jgi:hypothetical protein